MKTKNKTFAPLHIAESMSAPEKTGEEREKTESTEVYQPIIGIPLPVKQGSQGPLLLADAVGAWAVERMGARVFLIPLWPVPIHEHTYQSLWSLMQFVDGFLLPAGPQELNWYTQWKDGEHQTGPQIWSTSWEIALAQLATFLGMPMLSLADGAEKWNIALGGKEAKSSEEIAQTDGQTPDTWDHRTIRIRTPSKLASYVQPALTQERNKQKPWELAVLSHQGVEHLASGLRTCAQSEEGELMAFERQDAPFGLGILGRLDWGVDQIYGTAIFQAFLHACRSFRITRQQNTTGNTSCDSICTTLSGRIAQGLPLLPLTQSSYHERAQRSRSHSGPLSPSSILTPGQQERFHQRSHQPTKDELNKMRRQRLKMTSRET